MIYLILSILASTLLFVTFKIFEKFEITNINAIVVNYFTAAIFGLSLSSNIEEAFNNYDNWILFTLGLGAMFIIIFNIISKCINETNLSITTIFTKTSIVIPIVASSIFFNDSLNTIKITAILIALFSIFLMVQKPKDSTLKINRFNLILLTLVFIGSGFIDFSLKYFEQKFYNTLDLSIFSSFIFLFAGVFGLIYLIIKKQSLKLKDVLGGIVLGILNYYSLYFIIKTLNFYTTNSSKVFAINNVSVVLLTTIIGFTFYKERLNIKSILGIILAVASILVLNLG